MPKELVHGSELPFGDNGAVAVVETIWHRDAEHVQVATRCLDRSTHEPWVEHYAEPGGRAGTVTVADGFFVNLDRKGINDLIRNLRRARDQAYGRDE